MISFYFTIKNDTRYITITDIDKHADISIFKDEEEYKKYMEGNSEDYISIDTDLNLYFQRKLTTPGTVNFLKYVSKSYNFIQRFASIVRENKPIIDKWAKKKHHSKRELKYIYESIDSMQSWANVKFRERDPEGYY